MVTPYDNFIEKENHARFSIEIGKEVWETINKRLLKAEQESRSFRNAVERCCKESDYCYLCDNHPSHGHAKDCPLHE